MNERPPGGTGRGRAALRAVPAPGSRPQVHIGERLRGFRLRSGLSQEKAAAFAGLTRKSIARLESARFPNPHLSTLLRIMTTYKVASLEELLGVSPSARLAEAWAEEGWPSTTREETG
jgi:transcriptional regulator with XRE-family HTH domain